MLANHGRLSHRRLSDLLQIPIFRLRHTLAVLIRTHVLLHFTNDDDVTYYSVDWAHTSTLLRSSRIVQAVKDRYGEGAGGVVTVILRKGHTTVGDIAQSFGFATTTKRDSGVDIVDPVIGACVIHGEHSDDMLADGLHAEITTNQQLHALLRELLQARLLSKVGNRAYFPAADLQIGIENEVVIESFPDGKITGPKKQKQFFAAVKELKRKWYEADEYSEDRDGASNGIKTQSVTPYQSGSKRVKLNAGCSKNATTVAADGYVGESNGPTHMLPV